MAYGNLYLTVVAGVLNQARGLHSQGVLEFFLESHLSLRKILTYKFSYS